MEQSDKDRASLKQAISSGQVVVGTQLRLASPAAAELFSRAGFDFLIIDCEHSAQNPVGVHAQLQGIGCGSATPIVRLPNNDLDLIKLYLDMGAMGVVIPNLETAEDAQRGSSVLKYPPRGTRGYGPSRAAHYGLMPNYLASQTVDSLVYMPIIESERAVKNIGEILAVDGVTTFAMGPVDLSFSLGVPMQFDHPRMQDAFRECLSAARRIGKPAGTAVYGDAANPASFQRRIEDGFTVLLAGVDEAMLADGAKRVLAACQKARS